MDDGEHSILEEQFALYPGKVKYDITLTNRRFFIKLSSNGGRNKNEDIILLDDVTGCHVLQASKDTISSAYLCVYSYPLRKKRLGSTFARQRVTKTFTIDCNKTYQENLVVAEQWKMTVKRLLIGEDIRTREDIENGSLATRNLLVLVNPFSGRKKAVTIYKEKVRPMFLEAEIKHTVRNTTHSGHAKDIAKQLKLEDWDGIVIVSGDGLVHEIINGLMDRPDWEDAIKMPIGIVPGGSGNALAASLVYASTGQMLSGNLELDAIFEVLRGRTRKMSLAAIETESNQKYYSFLNFAWGFIADVDIESERFRKLGPVRFAIGCAIRVANMHMYHGRISYLPAVKNAYSFGRSQSYVDSSIRRSGDFNSSNSKSSSISYDRKAWYGRSISKRSTKEDAIHTDVDLVNAASIRRDSDEVFQNGETSGDHENRTQNGTLSESSRDQSTSGDNLQDQFNDIELNDNERAVDVEIGNGDGGGDAPSMLESTNQNQIGQEPPMTTHSIESPKNEVPIAWKDSAVVYHLGAPCDQPAPDDWAVIESEFVWVTSVYLSHLGNEMMGVPKASMDEDLLYIYTLRKGISKAQMISVLLGFEDGTHIEKGGDFSCVIPCRAVRLEPLNFITGHMTVDGELVPHCSIQASITPHKVNIMSSVSD